jgi:hypothetical protein
MTLQQPQTENARREPNKDTDLEVGSTVRVKSLGDIMKTLDDERRLDGCMFTRQMEEFQGQTYKIIKVVRGIFDERLCKMYGTKTLLYILDGLICEGDVGCFSRRCDRSCYFFWHRQWLETIPNNR